MIALLLAHLAAGIASGMIYFRCVRWHAQLLAEGASVKMALLLILGRFLFLGGALLLISFEGAMPLLITTLGVLMGRWWVLRDGLSGLLRMRGISSIQKAFLMLRRPEGPSRSTLPSRSSPP